MNPRLQAYLLQCIDHDETTVDQALLPPFNPPPLRFAEDRGDKAIIEDLCRQLTAVSAERDALKAVIGFVAPQSPDAVKRLEILARTNTDVAFWQVTAINITGAFEDVVSERDALREAAQEARESLSNWVHGGAQYNPDLLAADSVLREALEGGE